VMSIFPAAFFGLYLLAQANPEPLTELNARASIQASLVAVSRPLGFARECTGRHPALGFDAELEKLDKQYLDATTEAEGVWPDIDPTDGKLAATEAGPPWPSCGPEQVRIALEQAGEALSAYSRLFRELTATMDLPGAWAGPLHLCRDNVESATLLSDAVTEKAVLSVKLVPPLRASLSKVTEQSVGRPLPIRLDGAIIANPIVYDRIESGEFQVIGPEPEVLTRLAERTGGGC
jgi:hypothetical protein